MIQRYSDATSLIIHINSSLRAFMSIIYIYIYICTNTHVHLKASITSYLHKMIVITTLSFYKLIGANNNDSPINYLIKIKYLIY